MLTMDIRYTRHAIVDSMPDDKISVEDVRFVMQKAERRTRVGDDKFKFRYRDIEVVCVKAPGYWLVITAYRI